MPYKIAISYREESNGKSAFFDHFTLRVMTGHQTVICKPEDTTSINLANYINLRGDDPTKYALPLNADIPTTVDNWAKKSGFIFIPGYTRESDTKQPANHVKRIRYEQELINKARLRGQPVLAVCAGSWTLWENYGGRVATVSDHNYGGAMPRLSTENPSVCNNKMIHRVKPTKGSYLAGAIQSKRSFVVNSVHWKAPHEESSIDTMKLLEVSAYSKQDSELETKTRQSNIMKPEKCVEAFETKYGVPMMGIQWHPEAFNPKDEAFQTHQSIFSFMVTSGKTYLNRQKLNKEFKASVAHNRSVLFSHETPNELAQVEARADDALNKLNDLNIG